MFGKDMGQLLLCHTFVLDFREIDAVDPVTIQR